MSRSKFVIAAALVVTAGVRPIAQEPATNVVPTGPKTAASAVVKPAAIGVPLLAGTKRNILTTIQGNALDSTNGALANSAIRLRDARFGRVVGATTTDRSGLFSFGALEPGSYIVEVMGNDYSVVAASQIISINSGEAVTAVVKLPFHISPFAGVLGHSVPSAAAVTAEAAATGVLATTVSGVPSSDRPIS
jgi:hypothetical protein